jgi:large subunit ribosomal protein L32
MRLRTRKAANRWHAPKLGKCTQCGAILRSHTACPACGTYRGRQVLDVEVA